MRREALDGRGTRRGVGGRVLGLGRRVLGSGLGSFVAGLVQDCGRESRFILGDGRARGRKDVGRESETVTFAAVGRRGLDLEHLERGGGPQRGHGHLLDVALVARGRGLDAAEVDLLRAQRSLVDLVDVCETRLLVMPLGRRVKFTGRGERTASPGREVCWSKQANLCRWRRVPGNFTVPRAFESTIVQENVRVKFEDSVHSNKRGGLDA